MSYLSLYPCHRCNRNFRIEENLRFHYFCSARTEAEKSADFGALFSLTVKQSTEIGLDEAIINPQDLQRYLPNIGKFKEWVEEAKDLLIYKECNPSIKHLQTISILDGLFKIEHLDSYVFNEGLFLLPELQADRESVVWAFQQMLAICKKTDAFIRNSQRRFLQIFAFSMYEQWCKEDFKHLDPEDIEENLPLERNFIKLGTALGELSTLIRAPVIACSPNPQDPDRYLKLTIEVEPFELSEASPIVESEKLQPAFKEPIATKRFPTTTLTPL